MSPPTTPAPPVPVLDERDEPARILLVRLGAIGDVANALVLATALKDARPATFVGWVVHPLAAPLVTGHPAVDRVHVWRRDGGPGELLRLVRELRAGRYELAADLQGITKSALLARLSGAPRVLGADRKRAKELSWLWTREHLPARDAVRHRVRTYLDFAEHLGAAAAAPRHAFPQDAAAAAWAEALVAELGARPLVVNLGASKPANRWEPERFGRLARALAEESGPVCLTGGPGDLEAARAARQAAGAAPGVRDLVGATSLLQLLELLRRARLFVGCDTGPMHLAAGLGTPVIALFGPADPLRTGPWGAGQRVLRAPPPCAPCHRRTCNQPRHACMEDLTVEGVLQAARGRLAADSMAP